MVDRVAVVWLDNDLDTLVSGASARMAWGVLQDLSVHLALCHVGGQPHSETIDELYRRFEQDRRPPKSLAISYHHIEARSPEFIADAVRRIVAKLPPPAAGIWDLCFGTQVDQTHGIGDATYRNGVALINIVKPLFPHSYALSIFQPTDRPSEERYLSVHELQQAGLPLDVTLFPKIGDRGSDDDYRSLWEAVATQVKDIATQWGIRLRDQLTAFAALRDFPFPAGSHAEGCNAREAAGRSGRLSFCAECHSLVTESRKPRIDVRTEPRGKPVCREESLWHAVLDRPTCACRICQDHVQRARDRFSDISDLLPPYEWCNQDAHCPLKHLRDEPLPWRQFATNLTLVYNPQLAVLEGLICQASGSRTTLLRVPTRQEVCPKCHTVWWEIERPSPSDATTCGVSTADGRSIEWRIDELNVAGTNSYGLAHPAKMKRVGEIIRSNFVDDDKKNVSLVVETEKSGEYCWLRAQHVLAASSAPSIRDDLLDEWEEAMRGDPASPQAYKMDQLIRNVFVHGGTVRIWIGTTLCREYGPANGGPSRDPEGQNTFTLDMGLPVTSRKPGSAFWDRWLEQNDAR